jgi:uncharacterized protein YjiS (DUF1127 family)
MSLVNVNFGASNGSPRRRGPSYRRDHSPTRRTAMIAVLPSLYPQQASLASVASAARLLAHETAYLVIRLFDGLARWNARARERHILAAMDERGLRDIGLSRGEIAMESHKPFWQA